MAASNLNSECAVVFLVINQISDLPELAISSVLRNSNSPIFIGTVREQDKELAALREGAAPAGEADPYKVHKARETDAGE